MTAPNSSKHPGTNNFYETCPHMARSEMREQSKWKHEITSNGIELIK